MSWCRSSHLLLNTSKTKDMGWTSRGPPHLQLVSIEGVDVEVVSIYKYLGLQLDDKLDWTADTDILYNKGQNWLYFLRRLWSLKSFRKCS